MENSENTNYVHVEGQTDPNAETTITTNTTGESETQDNTVEMKPKVAIKSGEKRVSHKEQKFQKILNWVSDLDKFVVDLNRKTGIYAQYARTSTQVLTDSVSDLTTAIHVIYEEMFKNCQTIKEEDIKDEDVEKYLPLVGKYFKHGDTIVRMTPIEEGWVIAKSEPGEGTIEMEVAEGKKVQVPYAVVTFEFRGIAPNAAYPTTYTCQITTSNEAIMKLREYLFSLKEDNNKIIV